MTTTETVTVRGTVPMVASANGRLYVQVDAGALDGYLGKEIMVLGFNCAPRAARVTGAGKAFARSHKLYREDEDRSESGLTSTGKSVTLLEQRYYLTWVQS
jgi:hypothetical protein